MAFAKYGSPSQIRANIADSLAITVGARVTGPDGKNGSVKEACGLTLSVLFDGDEDPLPVSAMDVRRIE